MLTLFYSLSINIKAEGIVNVKSHIYGLGRVPVTYDDKKPGFKPTSMISHFTVMIRTSDVKSRLKIATSDVPRQFRLGGGRLGKK